MASSALPCSSLAGVHVVNKAMPINNIDSKCYIKQLKSSRTCLIGYPGFILCKWFLITWEVHTHTHAHTHMHIDFADKSNFKKPDTRLPSAGAISDLKNKLHWNTYRYPHLHTHVVSVTLHCCHYFTNVILVHE